MQPLTLNEQKLFNIRLTGLIVSALFLSACQSVGPNYTRPELPVPAQYSETVDQTPSKVSQTWWTQYQDATLNALLDKALQNNADIKLAIARIDEAEAFANEVGAATLPQVDLNAGASRTRLSLIHI